MCNASHTTTSSSKTTILPTKRDPLQNTSIQSIYGKAWATSSQAAVLLINLGSPKSPEVKDVASYLGEFLMDERVISISHFWRRLLVKGMIVPMRSKGSAANYRYIWDAERQVFPLVAHSATIAEALAHKMQRCVGLAMRYGTPEMDRVLEQFRDLGIRRLHVLPLYPHYTRSSFETASVHALERMHALGLDMELNMLGAFYDNSLYRKVLAESVRPYLSENLDRLIVSMHGIPLSHLMMPCRAQNGYSDHCRLRPHSPQQRSTCYRLHCEEATEFLRQDLGLKAGMVELVYQSRLGQHEWVKPYFAERVKAWPGEGIEHIAVVCPGFVCDCLETLHEIDVEYKEEFFKAGGKSFKYIPCLNSSSALIETLEGLILQNER